MAAFFFPASLSVFLLLPFHVISSYASWTPLEQLGTRVDNFKFVVVGSGDVGKSCITLRFVQVRFVLQMHEMK